jgi:hypothetical protein
MHLQGFISHLVASSATDAVCRIVPTLIPIVQLFNFNWMRYCIIIITFNYKYTFSLHAAKYKILAESPSYGRLVKGHAWAYLFVTPNLPLRDPSHSNPELPFLYTQIPSFSPANNKTWHIKLFFYISSLLVSFSSNNFKLRQLPCYLSCTIPLCVLRRIP